MPKSTKSTSERKGHPTPDQEERVGQQSVQTVTRVERASGPVHIPDQGTATNANHLYNVGGHLIWNGVDLTTAAQGKIAQMTTLDGLTDVATAGAKAGHVIARVDGAWAATPISDLVKVKHSQVTELSNDDHPQYLTVGRHSQTNHTLGTLSVADDRLKVSTDGVFVSGDMFLAGRSGILVSKGGRILSGANTDDLPEGDAKYLTPERVAAVSDTRYLLLDGSNIGNLRLDGQVVTGLNADALDGIHAADLAGVKHEHSHSALIGVSEDDHHPRTHQIGGPDHVLPNGVSPGSVMIVLPSGQIGFSGLDMSMVGGSLQVSRIGSGNVSDAEFSALIGIRGAIQTQLDRKSDINHAHTHASLPDLAIDQHRQYLTVERADAWLHDKSSDDLRAGATNRYYDPSSVMTIGDANYLRLDGTNHRDDTMIGLDADTVDGIHGSELARSGHVHQHSLIEGIGPDDHHPQTHGIDEHTLPNNAVGFLKVIDGKLQLGTISLADIPLGLASTGDVSILATSIQAHQDLIVRKANIDHSHPHSSLSGTEEDDHRQYLNRGRALSLIETLTSDSIREGATNRYFDQRLVWDAISPIAPLRQGADGEVTLDFNETQFSIVAGKLTLRRQADGGSVIANTLSVGRTLLLANDQMVFIGKDDTPAELVVSGKIRADGISLRSGNGIVSADGGVLSAGGQLGMMVDVDVTSVTTGQVLCYDGLFWRPMDPSALDLGLANALSEGDVIDIHRSLPHDIPSLTVGQGLFSVDSIKGSVAIGVGSGVNALDINGGVVIGREFAGHMAIEPGNLAVSGRIGVSTPSPRAALDLGGGEIIGGTHSPDQPNVLNLSSNADIPTISVAFANGGSLETSVSDAAAALRLSTQSAGSVMVTHSISDGTQLTVPKTMAINIGRTRRASFTESGIGIGVNVPRTTVDVRGTIGVSDGGTNPTNWMMLRSVAPGAPPSVCFPYGSSLRFGTLRSYDAGAVWNEMANLEGGDMHVVGRFRGGVHSVTLEDGSNDDVRSEGGAVLKLSTTGSASIGGLTDGVDGGILTILNDGDKTVGLTNESIRSAPENRIKIANGEVIPARSARVFIYDGGNKRWFPVA